MNNFTCQDGIYEGVTGNLNVLGEVQVMCNFSQCMEYPGNSKSIVCLSGKCFIYLPILELITTPRKGDKTYLNFYVGKQVLH